MPEKKAMVTSPPSNAIHLAGEAGEYYVWWNEAAKAAHSVHTGVIDDTLVRNMLEVNAKLMEERPEKRVDWIIDMGEFKKIRVAARKIAAQGYKHPKVGRTAFLHASLFAKAAIDMSTLFVGHTPGKEYEFVDDVPEAIAWLQKMRGKSARR